jgi:hypothetical protein
LFPQEKLSNFKPMAPLRLSPAAHRPITTAAAGLLLALFWWLAVSISVEKSVTSDELPHLYSGYVYDEVGDFRMQPENGNLPQRLFGIPALAAKARLPTDEGYWRRSDYWQLGWNFLYGLDNPADRIVFWARAINALFGVALGALIFGVARQCYGHAGGLLALGFYVLAPNFLAHSGLATSDMAATFFLTLAPWLFWRHLRQRDLRSGVLAGLASGLALVAKFNGILLGPIYFLLVLADAALSPEATVNERVRRGANSLGLAAGQAAISILLIWAFYNFRFSMAAPGTLAIEKLPWPWSQTLAGLGWKKPWVEFSLRWHLLPEAWTYGLSVVLTGSNAREAFFAGEHSLFGWWQFFPTLFLTKTSLAMLGALTLAGGAGLFRLIKGHRTENETLRTLMPLVVTTLVVWLAALTSHLNIGDRHILAVYPLVFVVLGSLATKRVLGALGIGLFVGHAYASFAIRPHYLPFFNSLIGGPRNAYHLFTDSVLDWGQDLPSLRDWLADHRQPGEKVYLAYFGTAWPPHYGVRPNTFLPAPTYLVRPPLVPYPYEPGLYCVSATLLSEVYSDYRGPWTPAYENRYRALTQSDRPEDYVEFDQLRFARLCKFLQRRAPDADVGFSILIFRLSAEELHAALEDPAVGIHRLRLP